MNKTGVTDTDLARMVRNADPDRFLGALFAPAPLRTHLMLLYAFNHELARARAVATNAPLALIRLHWWREVVDGAMRSHPVATPLRAAIEAGVFRQTDLLAMIDAREAEAEPIPDCDAFLIYMRGTAGALMRIAGGALGVADSGSLAALEDCGTGTGIVLLLRAAPALRSVGRDLLPQDGTSQGALLAIAARLLDTDTPRVAVSATLPAVFARRDMRRMQRGAPVAPRGLSDRLAVLVAGLRGRV